VTPLVYTWEGDSFKPLKRFQRACNERFVIGMVYTLDEVKGRSQATHSHYFACLHDGWMNLPEHLAERFQTQEHLRKWCLIKCGYHDQRSIVASSKAEAQRIAAFIKPVDEFAIVVVSECTVTIYTAKSQSKKAMGAKDFADSKSKVLDLIASMIGTDAGTLARNAEEVA
jgi:hypothetical protein